MYSLFYFFFNDPATTEIYTLSLHDALPISRRGAGIPRGLSAATPAITEDRRSTRASRVVRQSSHAVRRRSEEHTSELQSHSDLVCRLLLEKKKKHLMAKDADYENSTKAQVQ